MRVLFDKFPFVVVYLDNICIFSVSYDEQFGHVAIVFDVLRKEELFAHIGKCKFARKEVSFLGHTVSEKGLSVDNTKTETIAK